jgi:beta-lactamase class A
VPANLLSKIKVTLLLLGLLTIGLLLSSLNNKTYFDQFFFGAQNKISAPNKTDQAIQNYLQTETQKLPGDYGIFIKDLKRGITYQVNADRRFQTASLYKLAVMYKAYDALNRGELKKDDILTEDESTLDQILIPENDTGNSYGTISYNVSDALKAMITVSNNYSALLIANKLGWQNIDDFLHQQKIGGFDLVYNQQPTATAEAVASLMEQIFRNTAINAQSSQEMKDLLLAQQVNDRIPRYLPGDVKVAHKTGELDYLRHDAAIIYGKNSTYIFVFLSETPAPQDAVENIASLSKKMYDVLENPKETLKQVVD